MHPIIEREQREILAYLDTLTSEQREGILRLAKILSDNDMALAMALALIEIKAKVKS